MNEIKDTILSFAKEILAIPSPSGYTSKVIQFLEKKLSEFPYQVEKSKKGNLIITIPGKDDYTIGFSGHVDTLGAMVRSISSDGNLRFTTIGSPTWATLDGEYCTIHTFDHKEYTGTFLSTSPSAHVYKDASTKSRDPENMMIRVDEVVSSKEDVVRLGIEVGNFVSFDPKTIITPSGFIKSRFLDDKISVSILYGLISYLADHQITPKHTLKIIISTYEEVGHGAAAIPELNEFIAVDMGCVGEDLTCNERMVSICTKDSSGPYDYQITQKMVTLAKNNQISYATDIYPMYGSDVSAALRGGNDFRGGLIGPGVHASHGMERTHINGVLATFELLLQYIQ